MSCDDTATTAPLISMMVRRKTVHGTGPQPPEREGLSGELWFLGPNAVGDLEHHPEAIAGGLVQVLEGNCEGGGGRASCRQPPWLGRTVVAPCAYCPPPPRNLKPGREATRPLMKLIKRFREGGGQSPAD